MKGCSPSREPVKAKNFAFWFSPDCGFLTEINMKIELCAFADEADNTLDGQIEALKRNNIKYLEIRAVDGQNIKDVSLDKAREIRKKLDENDIKVWSIGSPVGKYRVDDDFDSQLESFRLLCKKAEILGATKIRMFSFFSKDEDAVFERLEKFTEIVPDGITLCHENEKDIFGDNIECCEKIHKRFDKIKMVFDPANFVQCEVDTLKAWDTLHTYIDYMHIKDALKDKRVVRAGYGIGNIERLIEMYINQGGKVLTLEPHLMEFKGLSDLENGQSISGLVAYNDNNEAFDAGVKALKVILDRLGVEY